MTGRLGAARAAALLVLSFALLWPGRAGLPPLDRDESRYAQATRQMIASGNWLDIRFQDQPRYVQPAGAYWAQAVAVSLAGAKPNRIWPYRLPSLLAGAASVVLTGWIGARLLGAPAGMLGAGLLAASLLLNFEARIATTDATLLACVLAAQAGLVSVWRGSGRLAPALLFWVAVGAGAMTKGPVALLPLAGTLAGLALAERRARWMLRLRPMMGAAILAVMILPWVVAIEASSGGAFLRTALGHNLIGKAAGAQEAHGGPPGYHLALFVVAFWPGSILAARAVPFAWAARRRPEILFLLAWIVPAWAVLEAVGTKLPHYALPLYPAVALLTAASLGEPARAGRWARRAFTVAAVAWGAVGAGLTLGPFALLAWVEGRVDALAVLAGALAACGVTWAAMRLRRGDARGAAFVLIPAAWLAYAGGFGRALPALRTVWVSPRLAAAATTPACPAPTLLVANYGEPSLVFLSPGPVVFVDPTAAGSLLRADPACHVAVVAARAESAFAAHAGWVARGAGEVTGFDYSNGKQVDLKLFDAPAPP